jgi:hypothetical protein
VALTSTRNLWLGSWFLANGLAFVRATRLAGPYFRANFFFDDPTDAAPHLTRRYLENIELQKLINARRLMGEVLDRVHERGACESGDVADALAAVDRPWSDGHERTPNIEARR